MRSSVTLLVILSGLIIADFGCTGRDAPDGTVLLDLDRKDPRPFVEFYFGLLAPADGDAFTSGLIVESEGDYFLNPTLLAPEFGSEFGPAMEDGKVDWDELKPFFARHYYDLIDAPATLADLLEEDTLETADWLEQEVIGVMSTAVRHVLVPRAAVRVALETYAANGGRLVYPPGTTIVADHTLDQEPVETTAMRKRADGRWDFFAYDGRGHLTDSTRTPPKTLAIPTQCTGCHLGTRLYEPEKSFPAAAPDGPDGPREIRLPERLRNVEAVRFLDEHRKRGDGILGLYGTIYLSDVLSARETGEISEADAALLAELGL